MWIMDRAALRVVLRGRWRKVGAAPGPTDPIASEEGGEGEVRGPAYDMAAQATPSGRM